MVADQSFWGDRVHALGAGPAPIPFTGLTVEQLASAIRECVTNVAMRERAAEIGRRIRCENGVQRAVEHLAGIFGFPPAPKSYSG